MPSSTAGAGATSSTVAKLIATSTAAAGRVLRITGTSAGGGGDAPDLAEGLLGRVAGFCTCSSHPVDLEVFS